MKQTDGKYVYEIYGHRAKTENVEISKLHDFPGHPFKVERDRQLFELAESIAEKGVLVPLMVRLAPSGSEYEIIAGHRRKAACEWVGLDTVPAMIVQMDDAEAMIAMVDSNLQREHIKPSEKAYAYKMKLDAMKQQGRKMSETLSQIGTKLLKGIGSNGKPVLRSDELLARQAGESRNQIARYIRLTRLIPKILDMVDEEKIAFTVAVELSYLKEEEQYELHAVMDLAQYFPEDFTPRQKVELIEKLVKEWHEKRGDIPAGKMEKA